MCISECYGKLRYRGIDIVYIGVKILYKHDETPHGSLKKRFPPPSPNDSREKSVGKIRQDNMALRMNATFLEVLREVLSGLLITKPNVEGSKRIRGRRWPRTLKRIPSRHGFTHFGCHSTIYLRERECEREIKQNTITTQKQRIGRKQNNVCMKNA